MFFSKIIDFWNIRGLVCDRLVCYLGEVVKFVVVKEIRMNFGGLSYFICIDVIICFCFMVIGMYKWYGIFLLEEI